MLVKELNRKYQHRWSKHHKEDAIQDLFLVILANAESLVLDLDITAVAIYQRAKPADAQRVCLSVLLTILVSDTNHGTSCGAHTNLSIRLPR